MSNNKEALKRYRIIHNVLRRGGKHKTKRIVELCNEAGISVKLRTIQKDLEDLAEDTELGLFLPIKNDKRLKAYYYEYIPVNIFPALELNSNEINALLFYAKTTNQYKDYPLFEEITNAVQKVIDNSNIEPKTKQLFENESFLETEIHKMVPGVEKIGKILESINERLIINIRYQKYGGDESKNHLIKPLLLKEDKQLWYIIGVNVKHNKIATYALDRIIEMESTQQVFDTISFNSNEYFKYSFGITVNDISPIEVLLSFSQSQSDYLKTIPLHPTQKIKVDNEKEFVITVEVKPSYEFYSKILSYGSDVKVISPKEVADSFLQKLEKAVENYKDQ